MDPVPDSAEPTPVEAAMQADPEELIHLARERARHGDYAGARLLCEEVLENPGDRAFTARYLVALSLEFEGRLPEALDAYDALMAEDPTDDVRFRRAETLGKLGRFDDARAALDDLEGTRALGPADLVKVRALEGTWDMLAGREKRGLKALRSLIDDAPSTDATFYLALARSTLLVHTTDRANALTFAGSDRKRAKTLETRAALVLEAEHGLADLIRLGETRHALDGFVAVERTYLDLGDDLYAEPVPTKLTGAQAEIYREELEKRVAQVWAKASLYCDKGLEYAARQDWTAPPVPTLLADRDAAVARIDAKGP